MKYGNKCCISNVIKGYQTLSNLYRLDMITTETYDKYFNNFYTMAENVYVRFIQDDEKMNERIKNDNLYTFNRI